MLGEATGLALLAAVSPTALLVCAVFLGSANPRKTVLIYLIGAFVVTAVTGAIVFAVLRAGHLDQPSQHQAKDGLRLGLGLLMLVAGLVLVLLLWRRSRRDRAVQAASAAPQQGRRNQGGGLVTRMLARPGTSTAFLLGSFLYAPSVTFVAAVQVVATSDTSLAASIVVMALVIVITVAAVWLPLVLYLAWPDRTGPLLTRFNDWLRRNGRLLAACALLLAGVLLTIDGAAGLSAKTAPGPGSAAAASVSVPVSPDWSRSAAGMAASRPWVAI